MSKTQKSALINATTQSNKAEVKDVINSNVIIIQLNNGENKEIKESIPGNTANIEGLRKLFSSQSDQYANLNGEYHEEINQGRELFNNYKVKTALDFFLNLKERLWNKADADNIIKFRIASNIGASYLGLGEYDEAAKFFIEANQYNPADEKSLLNLALGNLLLNNDKETISVSKKVIKKNPANQQAYSYIIQASKELLKDIINKIPSSYRKLPLVANAFALTALEQKKYEEAIKWTEIALEKDETIEMRLWSANIFLNCATKNRSILVNENLTEEEQKLVNNAIDLITLVWEKVENTELTSIKTECMNNRSLCFRFLGNTQKAIEDLDVAIKLNPDNTKYRLFKASLLFETKKYAEAEILLKPIVDGEKEPSSPLLYAQTLTAQDKPDEAIKALQKELELGKLDELLEREFKRYLVEIFLNQKQYDKARKIAETLDDSLIINLATQARVLFALDKKADAQKKLAEASKKISPTSSFVDTLSLADEYFYIADYETAAKLYEKITDAKVDSFFTRRLLQCYFSLQDDKKMLEITSKLRKKYGALEVITEMECAINEEIGNLQEAEKICKEYLEKYPDNSSMLVRLVMIYFRQQKITELNKLLEKGIKIAKMPLMARTQLAQIYSARGMSFDAIKLMYETRRDFFNESKAHAQYIGTFFSREKSLNLDSDIVDVDFAVCVEEKGEKRWYIIENRKDADINKNEIDVSHHIAKILKDKKLNEEVVLSENEYQKNIGKIVEIKSKYVYALHESASVFNTMFPDDKSFYNLSIDIKEGQKELPEVIKKMLDSKDERYRQIVEIYQSGKITLGMLSHLMSKNIIDTWAYVTNNPEMGLSKHVKISFTC